MSCHTLGTDSRLAQGYDLGVRSNPPDTTPAYVVLGDWVYGRAAGEPFDFTHTSIVMAKVSNIY